MIGFYIARLDYVIRGQRHLKSQRKVDDYNTTIPHITESDIISF